MYSPIVTAHRVGAGQEEGDGQRDPGAESCNERHADRGPEGSPEQPHGEWRNLNTREPGDGGGRAAAGAGGSRGVGSRRLPLSGARLRGMEATTDPPRRMVPPSTGSRLSLGWGVFGGSK